MSRDDTRDQDAEGLQPTQQPATTRSGAPDATACSSVGPYRLLQKLGEGGMGEVWLAEQQRPVRRQVALKLIKRGLETKQVVARFEAERQALALMDHPAVAKVLDAGSTPTGRPYFVMEYVRGVPIHRYCDEQRLTTRERLALFCQVCEGVQHAHQKAILHRDIKPSNVLVATHDGRATPKIIDFGVAKATARQLTDRTMFTEFGVLIGTPEYMSPEQAEASPLGLDTRTDVYSLGVVLYQLLSGCLPFESKSLRRASAAEIARRIREDEPPRPSTRVRTSGDEAEELARRRRTDVPALQRQLQGDLDWITMRAMEKDRTRRYSSPQELAADIRRHLADEPVLARPPSAAYRARKFVRRHKLAVAVVTVLAASVAVGMVGTAIGLVRALRAEASARHEAEVSARVSLFLADMLGGLDPQEAGRTLRDDLRSRVGEAAVSRGDRDPKALLAAFDEAMVGVNLTDTGLRMVDEQILARAVETIKRELQGEPEIAARLYHTIGRAYRELGLQAQAEAATRVAAEMRERHLGEAHPATLESRGDLAWLHYLAGRYEESESAYRSVLQAQRRVLGADDPMTLTTLDGLAAVLKAQRRFDESEPLHLEVLERKRRVLGHEHPATVESMNNLASLYRNQGRHDEAEPLLVECFEIRQRVMGRDHPKTLRSAMNLANLFLSRGQYADSERLLADTLDRRRRVLGNRHPDTVSTLYNLACLSGVSGDRSAALDWLRQAVEAGWAHADWMTRDPDLEGLHGPEFDALVSRARQNATAP